MKLIVFLLLCFSSMSLSASFYGKVAPKIKISNFDPELTRFDTYLSSCDLGDPECRKYFLEFLGFPIDEEITLSYKRLVQENSDQWEPLEKIVIKQTGLILRDGTPSGHLFYLSSNGLLPGERLCLNFTTEKGFHYEFSLIPHPLVLKGRGKKVDLEAELISLDPVKYSIKFPGFADEEQVLLQTVFDKRIYTLGQHQLSDSLCIVSPEIEGASGGLSTLIVTKKKGQKFKIDLPWGSKFLDYLEKSKFLKT